MELLQVADVVSREKGIERDEVLVAMEQAIQKAGRAKYGHENDIRAEIDRKTGEVHLQRWLQVADPVENENTQITIKAARKTKSDAEVGDYIVDDLPPIEMGRIAAQTAKQVIVQRIREAERDTVYNKYVRKLNDLVTGTVQRYEQRNMYITLEGRDEAVMYLDEQVPGEAYRINDFIRAYVLDVKKSPKGPQVMLSRAAEGLVQRLLELEVPEIADGTVEIMAIARDPGSRSKVAVKSNRPEVDPIGACLGPKSSRIANVTDNLRGEKVDIIRYDPAPATFISNALAPAKVIGVELFEDDGVALVIVPD